MGKPILLLRLEGPLQSWGIRARWDVRDTAPEPTKSGVVGLLGCALGLRRGDSTLSELDQSLRFGVRTENAGRFITDYQTITDYLPTAEGSFRHSGVKTGTSIAKLRDESAQPATILSPRDYLEDAAFLAGFEARSGGEDWLKRAAEAVRKPRWPLFLGRKACVPSRPVFEYFADDFEDLADALRHYDWDWLRSLPEKVNEKTKLQAAPLGRFEGWIETDDPLAARAVARQDALRANAARLYGFRWARPLTEIQPRNLTVPILESTP